MDSSKRLIYGHSQDSVKVFLGRVNVRIGFAKIEAVKIEFVINSIVDCVVALLIGGLC